MSDRHEWPKKHHSQWGSRQNCLDNLILSEAGCQAGVPGAYYFEVRKFSVTPHVVAYPAS
jgi:hypothetical protein